jgi:pilus assembly protein CpaE
VGPDREIVVLSPKGGSGKTTLATNIAVGLARRRPGEVLLVDLDLAFGDVAAALLLDPRPGLLDVALGGALPRVHRSGLHVVGAPDTAAPTRVPSAEELSDALAEVASRYTSVVIDTGAGFDAAAQVAAQRATDLVLVASMDVPTLLGLRKVLGWLDGLGVTGERHLVLNRADSSVGLDIQDVLATTRMEVAAQIPSSAEVTLSVNEGAPLTGEDGEGPVADAYRAIVARLAPLRTPWAP